MLLMGRKLRLTADIMFAKLMAPPQEESRDKVHLDQDFFYARSWNVPMTSPERIYNSAAALQSKSIQSPKATWRFGVAVPIK